MEGRIERQSKMLESEGAAKKETHDPDNGFSWRTTLPRTFAATDDSLGGEEGLFGTAWRSTLHICKLNGAEFY